MRPPLAAVLFDLDDTLHDDTATYRGAAGRVAHDVAGTHAIEADALLAAYVAQAETFWQSLGAESLGTPLVDVRAKMWRAALGAVGLSDEALAARCGVHYNRYRRELLQLWPGALELLARLRDGGCKLALITNGFAETHREKIALLALEDAFDEIFIADEVGLLNPTCDSSAWPPNGSGSKRTRARWSATVSNATCVAPTMPACSPFG